MTISQNARIEGNGTLDHVLTLVERREIVDALTHAGGRRTLAARMLGISRSRLYRRMDALGIVEKAPSDSSA